MFPIYETIQAFVGFLVATLSIIYIYFKWSHQYWKRKNVPYFQPSIPLGNIPNVLGDAVTLFYKEAKAKGIKIYSISLLIFCNRDSLIGWKYCGLYSISRPVLLVLDLDIIKYITTQDFSHFIDRGIFVNEIDEPIGNYSIEIVST